MLFERRAGRGRAGRNLWIFCGGDRMPATHAWPRNQGEIMRGLATPQQAGQSNVHELAKEMLKTEKVTAGTGAR